MRRLPQRERSGFFGTLVVLTVLAVGATVGVSMASGAISPEPRVVRLAPSAYTDEIVELNNQRDLEQLMAAATPLCQVAETQDETIYTNC